MSQKHLLLLTLLAPLVLPLTSTSTAAANGSSTSSYSSFHFSTDPGKPSTPPSSIFIQLNPDFPKKILERGINATLTINYTLNPDGTISNPSIVKTTDPSLNPYILDAFKKQKSTPLPDGTSTAPSEQSFTLTLKRSPSSKTSATNPLDFPITAPRTLSIKLPEDLRSQTFNVTSTIRYTLNPDGSISNPRITKTTNSTLDPYILDALQKQKASSSRDTPDTPIEKTTTLTFKHSPRSQSISISDSPANGTSTTLPDKLIQSITDASIPDGTSTALPDEIRQRIANTTQNPDTVILTALQNINTGNSTSNASTIILTRGTSSSPSLRFTTRLKPEYPPELLRQGINAGITVRLTLNPDGTLTDLTLLKTTNPEATPYFLAALQKQKLASPPDTPATTEQTFFIKLPPTQKN